ncbi:putative secreted protein (Por secretion system target) [Epilithonimonas xixisoli]|uniref:Putative secreted protein (Por secretion system target) n=1 Tax=Epilithonimonas xixisoli TaxID=1476462 RepID=A0A4R8IAR6_9FLAO|nr:putative secreted protein (Por secretion system target) [Epilithonimonas xixisoli]
MPFVTTWDLSKTGSGTTSLSFGVQVAGAVNYSWRATDNSMDGNGTINNGATDATITGLPAGKTIELSIEPANLRRFFTYNSSTYTNYVDRQRLMDVKQWGTVAWSSMQNAFYGCSNLNIKATDVPNLSGVTDMSQMFEDCSNLNGPANINSWNVGNVTNMSRMFALANSFNQNIGNWNVGNVTNMQGMFYGPSSFNQPIGNWNVGNVTNMQAMFNSASSFNQPIGNWDVGNVTNMLEMFTGASSFNQPIGSWDVSKVTSMANMFQSASSFNQNIDSWDVSKVTSMASMFQSASSFNKNIGNWNVGNVTSMYSMFYSASSFNENIGNWNVANVTSMYAMFYDASAFNQPIGSWDVSKVTTMQGMFAFANSFNHNIGSWDVSKVTTMQSMFYSASSFNQKLGAWTLNSGVNLGSMLSNSGLDCINYSSALMGWAANPATPSGRSLGADGRIYGTNAVAARTTLVTGKGWTISGDTAGTEICAPLAATDYFITTWAGNGTTSFSFGVQVAGAVNYSWRATDNTTNGTGIIANGTTNAIIIGLPAGKTIELSIEPKNFRRIFNNGTDHLRLTDVKQWGTVAWSSMQSAFYGCSNLNITATDVPNLIGVTNMYQMFANCISLNGPANINSWNVGNVTNMENMFLYVQSFNQNIGNWDVSKVTNMSQMFALANSFNQPIGSWDVSKVTNMVGMFSGTSAFNQHIGNWNVANVTSMSAMFEAAIAFNQPIGSWDVSKVTNMSYMFNVASAFNQPIGSWDVSKVTNMGYMFLSASAFNHNIGNWDVSKVMNMNGMFSGALSFNQNLGAWTLNSGVSLGNMLGNSGLDCNNYSSTLMGWAANPATPNNRSLYAFGFTYGTNAVAARTMLTTATGSGGKGWTISGDTAGVTACGTVPVTPDANNILYVNTAVVGGDGSGNSWANAIKELADALKWANTNKANFATTLLQIWVAKGTYKPMYRPDTFAGPNITDRNNSFLMVSNVKLYGGFAGTEATLAERNLGNTANATILSGDYNNDDVVTGTGATLAITGNAENAMHVVGSFGGVGVAELNGFVIKAGNANIYEAPNFKVNGYDSYLPIGGGILMNTSNPTIQNCIFKENSAINVGGAMALYPSSSKVINSLFVNNLITGSSWGGGAIINSGNTSQPIFMSCTITGNNSPNAGAIYNWDSPQPKIYNTIIYGNSSGINNTTGNDIQNSLIQGLSITTNGNINGSTNPLFANASAGDYRLQSTSLVIDKGSNTLYNANGGTLSTDKDLAGNSRLNSTTIDMGAYEYTVVTVPEPTAAAIQIYTGNGTIANLTATGDNLKWYAALTGGTALASTTALTDNTKYYVSQAVNNVESARTEVLAKRISDDAQSFCGATTVANLVTTPLPGNTVSWYSVSSGGTALANNTALATGDYYVEMRSSGSPIPIASGLNNPYGVAVANDSKIWVANRGGNTIQQLDANGNVLATKSGFSNPIGINIQKDGRLLVGDWGTSRILRTNVNGDNPVALGAGFDHAFRAVEQANGKLLVADAWNHTIKRMNADGSNTTVLASGFNYPASVAEDRDANIWVADYRNNAIKKMNSDGSGISSIGTGISNPFDLKIDLLGRIVFTQIDGKLRRMNPDGSNIETLYSFVSGENNLALESNGSILVTEAGTGRLYRLSPSYTTNRVKVRVTVNHFGAISYVDKNVIGGNKSGSSWANAAPELADVMRCARTQYDANNTIYDATPLKVFVALGTYKPLYNAADGQYKTDGRRDNAFVLVKNVQLYGGFDPANGISTLNDNRIFGSNGSILSADIGTANVATDNTYHVLLSSGNVGNAELNGFVVKDGYADSSNSGVLGANNQSGAAMYISNSSPTINNCSFTNNSAMWGGGIVINGFSLPVIKNCNFTNNRAWSYGGAISLYGNTSASIVNCFIHENIGDNYGGGLYSNSLSSSKLINTTIANNGVNAFYTSSSTSVIQNSIIWDSIFGANIATYSLIKDLYPAGIGNIDARGLFENDVFTNYLIQDYTLKPTSPAIDKANNVLYSASGENLNLDKDLSGNNRLSECTIDMGAYEYQNSDTYINWDGTSWSNTTGPTQSLGACINNNYNIANNFTSKNLKVLNGVLNIQPNSTVKVYGNITQSVDNNIVLESDANLIQTNDNAVNSNHKINVKRSASMRKMDYTYWGTPVSNQKLLNDVAINDGFSVGTPNNRIYRYNEPNDYFAATTDSHFVPGKGYAIRGKDGFDENILSATSYLFNGNANNGVYPATVQKSKNTILNNIEYEHGYNLIGNPYPSNIDFDKFFNLNTNSSKIFGKVWFWTNVAPRLNQSGSGYSGNNYATLTLTGGTPPTTTQPNSGLTPTQFIKVGQGFIVQVRDLATTTSPTVTHQLDFNNSIRTSETGVFYNAKNSSSDKDRFWLQLISPEQFTNTILVGYINGSVDAYDGDYDAEVMTIGDDAIYSKLDDYKLQIQGRKYPLNQDDKVPLGMKYAQTGIYQISLGDKNGIFDVQQTIYLRDKLLNKVINISENDYSFQAVKGVEDHRFEIVYKPDNYLDANSTASQQLTVYKDKTEFVVTSSQTVKKIQIFDMSGRFLDEVLGNSKALRISHQSLVNGGYVLKIYHGNDIVTKKVIK